MTCCFGVRKGRGVINRKFFIQFLDVLGNTDHFKRQFLSSLL